MMNSGDDLGFWYSSFGRYVRRVVTSLSIVLNTVLGGSSNQSFSARNWAWKRQGKFNLVWLIDFLFRDDVHCLVSWVYWTTIDQAIDDLRQKQALTSFDEDTIFDVEVIRRLDNDFEASNSN